jgi:hypothetical protein
MMDMNLGTANLMESIVRDIVRDEIQQFFPSIGKNKIEGILQPHECFTPNGVCLEKNGMGKNGKNKRPCVGKA